MKKSTKRTTVIFLLTFFSLMSYAQSNDTAYGWISEADIAHYQQHVKNKGLHLEFDAGYAPLDFWKVETTSQTAKKVLKADYTVGANLALVHQFESEFFLGGGTGVRMQQLSWEGEGEPYSKSYGFPFFVRFGATEGPLSPQKISYYLNADFGLMVGAGDLKTSIFGDVQGGIYYGSTKIGIGFMSTKPNPDNYFEQEIAKGYNVAVGLFMGFRIF